MLSGKVAFITGASAGIGAAVARSLSAEGVKLGLFVLTRPRGMPILETAFRPMKEASWG